MFTQIFPDPQNTPASDHDLAARLARRLEQTPRTERPYPHFVADQFFEPDFSDRLLSWLESEGQFELDAQTFYRWEYCTNLERLAEVEQLGALLRRPVLDVIQGAFERYFGTKIQRDWIYMVVHKMNPGDEVKMHLDPPQSQQHRLVVNLFRDYRPMTHGAFFGLANDPINVDTFIASFHGSAIGFPLNETAWHGVTQLFRGNRYSLVYGFYDEGRRPSHLGEG